jgi:putative flippase GtrA
MTRDFAKFCVVGAGVAAVDFGALWVLQHFLPKLVAVSLAYFLGVATHYALNKWWVFRAEAKVRAAELARYVLTVAVCWFCTVGVAWLALRFVTSNVLVAKLLAIPPAMLLSFLLMRRFVFR